MLSCCWTVKRRNMELFCRTYLTLLLLNFLNINYLLFFICKHDHYVTHYVTQHPLMLSQARNISYLSDPYSNSYSSYDPTFYFWTYKQYQIISLVFGIFMIYDIYNIQAQYFYIVDLATPWNLGMMLVFIVYCRGKI